MERTCAASAMEWSIQLEKGLRSKKPGGSVEAILQFGPQLQQWSLESESNIAANNIFDLMPGEDRLFANAILLRLADAFACGDKETRFAIVTVFLSELKHRKKKKHKWHNGLLSKAKVPNHLELLKRVKSVFDSGDEESKAFALVLFGCWADFAQDNAPIRYLVLSSLVSPHAWLVKASLFAAGCFCEISDDFASTTLEMLVNMVTSSEVSLPVKLDAARVFGKFRCSYSVANKAYKTGLELILDSLDEEFLVVMLVSLSKLASVSTLLIPEQVGLLLSFLSQERTSHIQETALRCLKFLVKKGLCENSVNSDLIRRLLRMLEEPEVSLSMHFEALRVLRKVLVCIPPLPFTEIHEFVKLITEAENAIQHADLMRGHLTIHILANLSCKFVGETCTENDVFFTSLPSRVVSLIKDQMKLLVKSLLEAHQNYSWLFQKLETLFDILLSSVIKHHHLVVLVLDNMTSTIEFVVTLKTTGQMTSSTHVAVNFDWEENTHVVSKFFCQVYRFLVSFLETLRKIGAIDTEVMSRVQILVEFLCHCGLLDCYTCTLYCLLLHSQHIWGGLLQQDNGIRYHYNLSIYPHSCPVNCKVDTVEFVNRILTDIDNWTAYRIGIYAACQGELLLSSSIFSKLIQEVKSNSCCSWLKALSQYTQSERAIQLLNLPTQGVTLVEGSENNKFLLNSGDYMDERDPWDAGSVNDHHYSYKLPAAYRALCSSIGLLEAAVTSSWAFSFQSWYLSLKARFLENAVGILKNVRLVLNIDWGNQLNNEGDVLCRCLKSFEDISQISFHFYRLAEEFDLIGTSFIEMDSESSAVVTALSLSCSLLAFVSGFAVIVVKQLSHENFMVDKDACNFLLVSAMQNLAGCLRHMDHETNSNFSLLLNFIDWRPTNCFHLRPTHQTCDVGFAYRDFLNVCSNVISEAACLANKISNTHNETTLSKVSKNLSQLILDTITKWIRIPPRIPKYFFKVRQVIGSELFVHSEDTKNGAGISVLLGSSLSLNLCLQLKNLPPNLHVRPKKLYCILYCPVSCQVPTPCGEAGERMSPGYEAWKDKDIVELNKKLYSRVADCMANKGRRSGKHGREEYDGKNNRAAETFLEFVPNQKGQGFSSCLLDVSDFPVGSYRIKSHSCLLDGTGSYWSLLPLNMGPIITVHT
ncbi:uncharacterized protein LOC114717600 [Neltuma alba]|uniref:uncharacterized protein LOC114717600 n=1 Tax=Neltuma alba TaxID=207710 RepID=UPI0010A59FB0|nr:uncharacterized protein LOC114717600 [Prosopis alba]